MKILCPNCRDIFPVTETQKGTTVPCPKCSFEVSVPSETAAPGVVLGDFLIERSISSGGMGDIFVARQLSLDREVALKVLQEKFNKDPEYAESLLHEARAAAKLNHPNIVQAYAVGKEDGAFYFAMEYIRGETYKQILRKKKRLDGLEAAKVILDVSRALDAAWNEQKLVHQDIKPENIMQDASGFAKLADLGLARRAGIDKTDEEDEVMGTPQYISPEQLTGVPTDVRSDIYSLGATFYHFVTGRFPYVAPTTEEITQMHVDGVLQPPVEVYDHLSPELNRIIIKMMARDPLDRYQTPRELISDLENFIRGEQNETTRGIKIRTPWSKKKKIIVFSSAGTGLVLAVCGIFAALAVLGGTRKAPRFAAPFCEKCHALYRSGADRIAAVAEKLFPTENTFAPAPESVSVKPSAPAPVNRLEMLKAARALLIRLSSGERTGELLEEFDLFCRDYAVPRTEAESNALRKVIFEFGALDESMRFAAPRTEKAAAFGRIRGEIAEARRIEKERLAAEKARREARRRAEKERADKALAEYRAALKEKAEALFAGFLRAAENGGTFAPEKTAVPPPVEADPGETEKENAVFRAYCDALNEMLPQYVFFLAQIKNLENLGISVSVPGRGICRILAVSPERKALFRTGSGESFELTLDESRRRETVRFLSTLGRTLKLVDGDKRNRAVFYFALYTGNVTAAAIDNAPGDFWNQFAKKWGLELSGR